MRRQHQIQFSQLIAYLLLVGMMIYVWSGQEQDDRQICETIRDNRNATRNVVVAIYDLGEDLVIGEGDEVTPQQQATLARFELFRDQQLETLDGPVCKD